MLEQALNRYLALDPESSQRLHKLENKVANIELRTARTHTFQIHFHHHRAHLTRTLTHPADITITGTPLSLLTLALTPDKKHSFFKGHITIEGDAELGQQITELFDKIDIDWEEYLSHLVGDIPAYKLSQAANGILNWGKQAKARLLQNVNEYVHEEKPWFPPQDALQDFFQEIDELRLDLDRLEARIKNL